jgi:xanthine dehydrogenase accessory factor
LGAGHQVAFARVINRVGFSGDTELELLACNETGNETGDLLNGTILDVSRTALHDVLSAPAGAPVVLSARIELDRAVDAGFSCGGVAQVLVQRATAVPRELWSAIAEQRPVVLATGMDGAVAAGGSLVVLAGQELIGSLGDAGADVAVAELAARFLGGGLASSEMLQTDAGAVLVEAFIPEPHVIVAGGGSVAEAIVAQAHLLGWTSRAVANVAEAIAALQRAGQSGAMVVLSHDVQFGPDALYAALRSEAFFVGAMGSRRTQANRATRLGEMGVSAEDLGRVHGPVGLDLGGRSPAQIALAICAEVLSVRTGRDGAELRTTNGSIRNRPPAAR